MSSRRFVPRLLSICAAGCISAVFARSAPAQTLPTIVSTVNMGTVTQNPLILERDGTYSAVVGGKSFWAFNDTAMRAYNINGNNFISNTLAWTTNLNASNGIYLNRDHLDKTGVPIEYMPFTADEQAFNEAHDTRHCTAQPASTCGEQYAIWPGPLVPIPGTKLAYQFYGLIFRGGDVFGFQGVGTGIAIMDDTGKVVRPEVSPGTTHPTLTWQGDEIGYAGGWLVENGDLYAIGCKGVFVTSECGIARVPVDQALNKARWRYYTAKGTWSKDEKAAVPVFNGGASGNMLFYDKALKEYLVTYSGNFESNVYYRAAPHPWGPWTDQAVLFTGLPTQDGSQDYAAFAHPEFEEQNGLVEYVTYVQESGFFMQNLQLVKVTFAKP